ncbi:MAG: hypothetical protein LC795_19790 [Acidobacteria bacterium]|nr:hypothetical protein [Acidobacteriota bacterium]
MSLGVIATYYKGNSYLEAAILAELNGSPNPELFRAALGSYESSADQMVILEQKLAELIEIDRSGKKIKVYEDALGKILRETPAFERLSMQGVRYSNVGGVKRPEAIPLRNLTEILVAQRDDLKILRGAFREAIESLREAIPIAEKGQFVPVMLSGRNAFGDKMPKFTDMISAYERFNIRSCMATIDATMQVYPAGFEWLRRRP